MLPIALVMATAHLQGMIDLQDLDLSGMSQDWGSPHKNLSVDGHPLTVAGKAYERGIGTHARSEYTLRVNGNALRFDAWVGVDSEVGDRGGTVRFEVIGDGKELVATDVMRSTDPAKHVQADLHGVRVLELVVDDAGDGIDYDHADWLNPTLWLADASKRPTVAMPEPSPTMKIADYRSSETEIHGPQVVGTTPGRPFLFRIPATGAGALSYRADGLPHGLALDPAKGIITGTVEEPGDYSVELTVRGDRGAATRGLRIVAGPHMLALTPPMGWNSWNVWAGAVDADKVRAAADMFVKSGLADFGYQYVNIDDTWEADRDANGEIQTNKKFGQMAPLADYVHSLGLKLGIYSSPGPRTCGGYTGSYQHELQDAQTYAKWGIDYLKYDWCSYGEIERRPTTEGLQRPYVVMSSSLDKVDRDIVFSLCQYGMGDVSKWGKLTGGNLWRTTGDINDSWRSMSGNGFSQSPNSPYAGPGAWNDPDMLVVGWLGWGPQIHKTRLTENEQITHITLWSLLASPLLIGCDLTKLDQFTKDVLMNSDVIDVDQDSLAVAATRRTKNGDLEVWARELADGSTAVGLFNRSMNTAEVSVKWTEVGLRDGSYRVRDLWQRKDLGSMAGGYSEKIPAHGAALIKVGGR